MPCTKAISSTTCLGEIKTQVFLKEKDSEEYFPSDSDWEGVLDSTEVTLVRKLAVLSVLGCRCGETRDCLQTGFLQLTAGVLARGLGTEPTPPPPCRTGSRTGGRSEREAAEHPA